MAGGGAVLRVDSFEGGQLPSKAQIKSIHITRDAFAAENHSAGGLFIDIITQPGIGPLRGGIRYNLRDGSLSGRSPFTPTKGPERSQKYGTNFARIADQGARLVQRVVQRHHVVRHAEPLRRAADRHALRSARAAQSARQRLHVRHLRLRADQGPDAAHRLQPGTTRRSATSASAASTCRSARYTNEEHGHTLRVQEVGPLGRRFFTNTRLSISDGTTARPGRRSRRRRFASTTRSRAAARRSPAAGSTRTFNLASDLDYVRGMHSVRTGIVLERRLVPLERHVELSRHLHLREPRTRSKPARRAATRGASAIRTSSYWNLQAGWLHPGRHPRAEGSDAQPGPSLRSADASRRLQRVRAALRRHVGAVQERQDDASRERRRVLRLAEQRHLRADAARRRLPAAGAEHRQPVLSRSRRRRHDPADQQVPARRRSADGEERRASASASITPSHRRSALGVTYAHVNGIGPAARAEPERARRRRSAPTRASATSSKSSATRTSRQNTVNAFLQVDGRRRRRRTRARSCWNWKRTNFGINYTWGRLRQQHRRRVQRAGDRQPRRRVGAGAERRPPPPQRVLRDAGAAATSTRT